MLGNVMLGKSRSECECESRRVVSDLFLFVSVFSPLCFHPCSPTYPVPSLPLFP
jgi:hypothetical protein